MSKLSPKQPDIEFQVELEENLGSNTGQAINPTKDVSYKLKYLHAHLKCWRHVWQVILLPVAFVICHSLCVCMCDPQSVRLHTEYCVLWKSSYSDY